MNPQQVGKGPVVLECLVLDEMTRWGWVGRKENRRGTHYSAFFTLAMTDTWKLCSSHYITLLTFVDLIFSFLFRS